MGIVNNSSISDILQRMNDVYSTTYTDAFNNSKTYTDGLVEEVTTTSDTYRKVWLTSAPRMRKALGVRHIKNLEAEAYATSTADYEATVGIPRSQVLSDQWNLYVPNIRMLGNSAKRHVDDLVKSRIQSGVTDLTFDGLAHFSTLHDLDPAGVQSNLLSSTALSTANFATAVATMRSYTDNQGIPIGVEPRFLMVPPALEKTARDIVLADLVANGTTFGTNTFKGLVDIIVNPLLSNEPTVWYLTGEANGLKPITHISFIRPNLVAKTNPDDDNVFHNFEYVYGVDLNDDVQLGLWFQMIRCVA